MVRKFRKKPVEIEAILWTGNNLEEAEKFIGDDLTTDFGSKFAAIHTLEGTIVASPGDWIIKGVEGEFYPCKPNIFKATYEEVK